MRITKKIIADRTVKWKRKFAFFPKKINHDYEKGIKLIVWLEFYEERCTYYSYSGWNKDSIYRLINK